MSTGIATTLRLVDQMTAPIMSITNSINSMVNRFNAVENAADIDTSSLNEMRNQVNNANAYVEQLQQHFNLTQETIEEMTRGQNNFNNSVRQGGAAADGLVKKIGAAVAAYATIQTIKGVLNLSDEMTQTTARLDMMNDGLQTTQDLQNKIFLAAQRSRGEYQVMADSVSKMGLMAGDAFSSNDELIAFTEQLNKQFIIAGTNADGIKNAMLQLTQAMGSGVLRGDELNSIFEQAPTVIQSIANYLEVPIGKIREMAQEGQLTADVVKAAMLSAADETNARFDQMPKTFGQVATSIKNQAIMAFQPMLNKLNEIANSPAFQVFIDNVINSIVVVAGIVMMIFDMIGAIAQFASDNWSWLAPIIGAVVAVMTAYVAILAVYNTVQAISNGLKAIAALRESVHAAATAMSTGATFAQTAAQYGLNAALLACPLTWIILAIIAIIGAIYLVIGIINKVAGTSISATGVIFGAFAVLGAFLWDLFLGLLELVLGVIEALINPFIRVANFIGNVFTNPISSIIYMFQGMADGVLAILQKIASALDFVFGSNMADTVAGWRSGLKDMADAAVAEYAPNENYQNIIDELDLSVEGMGLKRWEYGDAWNTGYAAGEAVDEAIGNFDPASLFASNIPTADDYGAGYTFDPSAIESGVGNIDANTSKQADYSEEELKLWRDIAERDTINRFTTAEITVEFGGVTNNVASEMDLDGIIDYIADGVEETLLTVAEGVHE